MPDLTPEQAERVASERDLSLLYSDGRPKMHRHFGDYDVHRDDTCTRASTWRRVYVFDEADLDNHERYITDRLLAQVEVAVVHTFDQGMLRSRAAQTRRAISNVREELVRTLRSLGGRK